MTGTVLTREWAEAHGCPGFLRKPIEDARLLQELRNCLAEPASPPLRDASTGAA
jgi:hypothetical protein